MNNLSGFALHQRRSAAAVARAGLLALALTLFTGCNSEYIVKVHNDGRRPVRVRLIQDQVMADPRALTGTTVPPGQAATLGPVKATVTDDVSLEIDSGELGLPAARQRVYPGTSEYRVGGGEWGTGGITEVERK